MVKIFVGCQGVLRRSKRKSYFQLNFYSDVCRWEARVREGRDEVKIRAKVDVKKKKNSGQGLEG